MAPRHPGSDECALKASVNSVSLFSNKTSLTRCLLSPFTGLQYFGGWKGGSLEHAEGKVVHTSLRSNQLI